MTHSGLEFLKEEDEYVYSATSTDTTRQMYFLNLGEKPLKPIVTKLSDILEENPDPKYDLSAKACQGILNRANRRGKDLPAELRTALESQANTSRLTEGGVAPE